MIKKLACIVVSGIRRVLATLYVIVRSPYLSFRMMKLPSTVRGYKFSQNWTSRSAEAAPATAPEEAPNTDEANPLKVYFDAKESGRGIWKWNHYFDIYHEHFSKFRGREVHVLEIGVYSGGSLEMWRDYFGQDCHIYGVDIEEACKTYENAWTKIFIGDQEDREFWSRFRQLVPRIDILIDDGGHTVAQQIVTLEEMLPHLAPGGVYLCEDAVGDLNDFHAFAHGLATSLSHWDVASHSAKAGTTCTASQYQNAIRSVHSYPFVTVIEKSDAPLELCSPKHGAEWQPFLD